MAINKDYADRFNVSCPICSGGMVVYREIWTDHGTPMQKIEVEHTCGDQDEYEYEFDNLLDDLYDMPSSWWGSLRRRGSAA